MRALNLHLTVEVLGGESIENACADLTELSDRIGACVEMKFNGVTVIAKPGADPQDMVNLWRNAMDSTSKHKIVVGHPTEVWKS